MLRAARTVLLALMLLVGLGMSAPVSANPFEGLAAPSGEAVGAPDEAQRAPGPLAAVGRALLSFQREATG